MSRRLRMSIGERALCRLAASQMNALFFDGAPIDEQDLIVAIPNAIERLEYCFSYIDNKYFFDGESAVFDHLHGDQYAMWLYILSNELHRRSAPDAVCKKLFLLNKALHGIDAFYEVELPSIFLFVHPLGTVLGRGSYSDYLLVYQRCGIGANRGAYPTLGRHLTLHPGSAVLGACHVADNCTLGTESLLLGRDLPANSVYIGDPRNHRIRTSDAPQPVWRI